MNLTNMVRSFLAERIRESFVLMIFYIAIGMDGFLMRRTVVLDLFKFTFTIRHHLIDILRKSH